MYVDILSIIEYFHVCFDFCIMPATRVDILIMLASFPYMLGVFIYSNYGAVVSVHYIDDQFIEIYLSSIDNSYIL